MEKPYCRKVDYEALYGSYLRSDPNELLDAADIPVERWDSLKVLDLCGGNGRLSIAAGQRGAEVTLLDADLEMCDWKELTERGIRIWTDDVFHALGGHWWAPFVFDAVFCQQAVNYWLWQHTAQDVNANMAKGGVFVFNTFNTVPPTVPIFCEKNMGDHKEYEAFYSANGIVHHVQLREGYAPHQTSFRWIPPDEFDRILEPLFEVGAKDIRADRHLRVLEEGVTHVAQTENTLSS